MSGWDTGLDTFDTFAEAITAAACGESHYQLVTPGPERPGSAGDVTWLVRGLKNAPETRTAEAASVVGYRAGAELCVTCDAPHEGDCAWQVFTEEQLRDAIAFCRTCGWPEFESNGNTYRKG